MWGDKILPTWIFLNSFQLILHLPLFDIPFPPNALFFYKQNLDLIRLNSFGLNQMISKLFNRAKNYDKKIPSHNFVSLGYESIDLIENCGIFILLIALCVLAFLICKIKSKLCGRKRSRRNSRELIQGSSDELISNILVRLLYQSFFELCLCAMLNLKYFEGWKNVQKSEFSL